jgi:AcrR family transcriptional regulator
VSNGTVREQILATASELFYLNGVHAVGVDTIIARAGIAKSSLYRHFRSKDELIAAYVRSEDEAFWRHWDLIAGQHTDLREQLMAILTWIGTKIDAPRYRGCPQLNVVAEFPDVSHPARKVASDHKAEFRRRLTGLAEGAGCARPEFVADQLWLILDGAFANHDLIRGHDPVALLVDAATSLLQTGDSR